MRQVLQLASVMIFPAAVRPIKQDANVYGNVIACQGSGKGLAEELLTEGLLIPMIQDENLSPAMDRASNNE